MNDLKNLLQADAKLLRKAPQRRLGIEVYLPDLSHVVVSQFRHSVSASFRSLHPVVSALASAVGIVLLLGAEEQMIGANACGDVAVVANEQSIGDRTIVQFPRDPMRP